MNNKSITNVLFFVKNKFHFYEQDRRGFIVGTLIILEIYSKNKLNVL